MSVVIGVVEQRLRCEYKKQLDILEIGNGTTKCWVNKTILLSIRRDVVVALCSQVC